MDIELLVWLLAGLVVGLTFNHYITYRFVDWFLRKGWKDKE